METWKLEVEGVPNAQGRPRIGKGGGFYNPNSRAQKAFKTVVKGNVDGAPVFGEGQPVAVDIKFYMRRPNTHFKGKDRSKALKTVLPFAHVAHPDIDNLAKFVLDGMNGLVYKDDKQVAKLVVCKLFDSEGECNGRTTVEVIKMRAL